MVIHFPLYSFLSLSTGLLCLGLGFFIFAKNKSSQPNRLYFAFCVAVFVWLFFASALSSKYFPIKWGLFLARLIYTGVVFLPTFALHFCVVFLKNNTPRDIHIHIKIAYFFTFVFLFLVWTSNEFIVGTYEYWWGYYPRGGILHRIYIIFVEELLYFFFIRGTYRNRKLRF